MGNLEHNIKEAFARQDAKTRLANKDAMWNRLQNQMGYRMGVAAIWRIAAVFLGLMLTAGVFAALNSRTKQQSEIEKITIQNRQLETTIDSLLSLSPSTQTEIKIVEKEKIVYRFRSSTQQILKVENIWKQKYQQLSDSTDLAMETNSKQYRHEIKELQVELASAKQELARVEQDVNTPSRSKQTLPFELKSERVELGISKKPAEKNSDVGMKIFQKNFIENRNNLNSTIFKK